jgi:hypothetical protein
MEIKNFIEIYDEVLPWNVLSNFIKFINKQGFNKAEVGGDDENISRIDFNIRRTYVLPLTNLKTSLSYSHWYTLLYKYFGEALKKYIAEKNIIDLTFKSINNIEVLKYENTGFYTWHVDHFAEVPRTMSCILLLNNDYEGGNLCFRNPDGSGEWEVEVKPNRMIVWPSAFLYPHTVKPVTKGTRYSVVAWAL